MGSPSLNSKASADPVDAPDGTEAEAVTPPSKTQVARTVGLPRLSRISRPKSLSIFGMGLDTLNELMYQIDNAGRRVRNQLQDYLLLSSDSLCRKYSSRDFPATRASRHPSV